MFTINNQFTLIKRNIHSSSMITFHLNELESISRIIDVAQNPDGSTVIFLDKTPFHPVDIRWPDQPADKGTIIVNDESFNVIDCIILGVHKETNEIRNIKEILKEDKDNWYEVVGHVLDNSIGKLPNFFLDVDVLTKVDIDFRNKLSLHHTSSHLAAFAINYIFKKFWRKDPGPSNKDSLGSPNFDKLAMEKSSIFPDRSEDLYKLGKSLKKKGFESEQLLKEIEIVQSEINTLLNENWLKSDSRPQIIADGPLLNDRRRWQCDLNDVGTAELPCGGTHVSKLPSAITCSLTFHYDQTLQENKLLLITAAKLSSEDSKMNNVVNSGSEFGLANSTEIIPFAMPFDKKDLNMINSNTTNKTMVITETNTDLAKLESNFAKFSIDGQQDKNKNFFEFSFNQQNNGHVGYYSSNTACAHYSQVPTPTRTVQRVYYPLCLLM